MLIHRWCCDASRTLEVTYQRCLQYHALLEVVIIDLLNNYLKLYSLSMQFINYQIQIKHEFKKKYILTKV